MAKGHNSVTRTDGIKPNAEAIVHRVRFFSARDNALYAQVDRLEAVLAAPDLERGLSLDVPPIQNNETI